MCRICVELHVKHQYNCTKNVTHALPHEKCTQHDFHKNPKSKLNAQQTIHLTRTLHEPHLQKSWSFCCCINYILFRCGWKKRSWLLRSWNVCRLFPLNWQNIKSFCSTILLNGIYRCNWYPISLKIIGNSEQNRQNLVIIWMLNNENEQFMCLQRAEHCSRTVRVQPYWTTADATSKVNLFTNVMSKFFFSLS